MKESLWSYVCATGKTCKTRIGLSPKTKKPVILSCIIKAVKLKIQFNTFKIFLRYYETYSGVQKFDSTWLAECETSEYENLISSVHVVTYQVNGVSLVCVSQLPRNKGLPFFSVLCGKLWDTHKIISYGHTGQYVIYKYSL